MNKIKIFRNHYIFIPILKNFTLALYHFVNLAFSQRLQKVKSLLPELTPTLIPISSFYLSLDSS